MLRKASESTADVSEAGRPLEAGSLSRARAGFLLQIEDLEKESGIRNTARRAAALRTSLKGFFDSLSRSKVCSGFAAVRWEMFICREFCSRPCLYR